MKKLYFVSCPKGVEHQLQAELESLGGEFDKQTPGGVYCWADLASMYRICLWSRFANKVVWIVDQLEVVDKDNMFRQLKDIPWAGLFSVDSTFAVAFKGSNRFIKHTNYGALLIKDAVVDCFQEERGRRPNVQPKQPDVQLYAHIKRNELLVGVEVSGGSLHRRGYRLDGAKAPLKENLAAALLDRCKITADDPRQLIDPMCGSGTLMIEAVLMKLGIAPGINRGQFGFESLLSHDDKLWAEVLQEARDKRDAVLADTQPQLLATGFDMDGRSIDAAKQNARRAGVSAFIQFKQQALQDFAVESGDVGGLLVCNPPYGERLQERNALFPLYQELGEKIRQYCQGWQVAILSSDDFLLKAISLKKTKAYTYFNGALKTQWLLFDIFKRDKAVETQQETVKDERFEQGVEMVMNRLRKNVKRLKKWISKNEIHCYRLYDADMPEYAFALDCYQGDAQTLYQVTEYAPPKSVDEYAAFQRRQQFSTAVKRLFELKEHQLVLKERRQQKGSAQYEKQSESKRFFKVREGQATVLVNLHDYLDTGLFLDHRPVRLDIAKQAKDKRFLNLFCYTAVGSVHAALGGAASTTSVDMSQTYLDWGERNFKASHTLGKQHKFIRANVMEWVKACNECYDLIFLDPPSFSNSKRMDGTLDIQRDHVELIDDTMALLEGSGTLIFSNNRRGFKLDAALSERYQVKDITFQTIDEDFKRNSRIHQCWTIRWPEEG